MPQKIEFSWEEIFNHDDRITLRAKVFGGWIIESITIDNKRHRTTSVFIPDRYHEWIVIKPFSSISNV